MVVDAVELSIPRDWDEITPAWATKALSERCPGAEVAAITVRLRDDGTNKRARLGLTYSAGTGPATVFAKAADLTHTAMNSKTGGVYHEPRLYLSGVPLAVDHPIAYASVIDEAAGNFLIVMEDVTARGGDPRDATRPISVDQAANGVRGLARLHSQYWGRRVVVDPALGWLEPFVPWSMGSRIPTAIEQLGDTIPKQVRGMSVADIMDGAWVPFIRTLTTSPMTLLHGDPHIGNTYVLPDDDVGFLDWQVVRRGNWSLDVGYFLQGALTEADRRQHQRDLLEVYRTGLNPLDDEVPGRDEVWLRYRASAIHGLATWLATLSTPGWQRPEVSTALAQRYAAAYVDLDASSALSTLISSA
jgi:hypothetical protein